VSTFKRLSKYVSLDPNDVVVPEEHFFAVEIPNSSKYYTAISILNMQKFAPGFSERKF